MSSVPDSISREAELEEEVAKITALADRLGEALAEFVSDDLTEAKPYPKDRAKQALTAWRSARKTES